MTFSWHGHVLNKMAAMCSRKRRRYPPVCCAMMFHFVWEGLSAWIVWIFFASSASLWHHLVVESRVHHTQSCAFPRKHEKMWQTTEVSPKINNLASNGHVPHAHLNWRRQGCEILRYLRCTHSTVYKWKRTHPRTCVPCKTYRRAADRCTGVWASVVR